MTLENTATAAQYNKNPRETLSECSVCLKQQDPAYLVELRNGESRQRFGFPYLEGRGAR